MKIIRPMTINDAALVSSNVTEADYAAWSSGTTYASGTRVIVTTPDVHKIYESVQGSNTNHDPITDTTATWWLEISATNRWKMFDGSVGSQTTNATSIAVVVTADGRADSVALLNVSAATVRVTMTDAVEGVVYDQTEDMVSDSGITDWYAYFFEPIERKSDIVFGGMPPYSDAQISITLTDTGATAACGECIIGLSKEIGTTDYGAQVGIQDFSIKAADEFGTYTITERSYANRGTFTVWVDAGYVDALKKLLAAYRATPVVYIGSDDYAATIIYGFFKDFSIDIAYSQKSICSIELEGLS